MQFIYPIWYLLPIICKFKWFYKFTSDEGWRTTVSGKDLTSEAMMDATCVLHDVTPNPTKSACGAVKCQVELFFSPRSYWWSSVNVAFKNTSGNEVFI